MPVSELLAIGKLKLRLGSFEKPLIGELTVDHLINRTDAWSPQPCKERARLQPGFFDVR